MQARLQDQKLILEIEQDDVAGAISEMDVNLGTITLIEVLKDVFNDFGGVAEFEDHTLFNAIWNWLYDVVKLYDQE